MTQSAPASPSVRGVDLYYLVGTPVFALLDYFAGISVRAAFLDGWPAARYAYYGVCFGCGLAAWRAPAKARFIAMAESSVNIVLLIFSIMLGYYAMIDRVANDLPPDAMLGKQRVANLAIAATALMFSYFRSHRPAANR